MKKIYTLIGTWFIFFALIIISASCKKENSSPDISITKEIAKIETMYKPGDVKVETTLLPGESKIETRANDDYMSKILTKRALKN